MVKRTLLSSLVWIVFILSGGGSFSTQAIELSGYYKNLAVQGRTFIGKDDDYFLDVNRLRVELNADYKRLHLNLQYDNEGLLGSYLDSFQYQQLSQQPSLQYWTLEKRYINGDDLQASHKLYRGYLAWQGEKLDVRLGRQQINWSTALIWNPMDRFNPLNPIQLERDERLGVDALNMDYSLGDTSTLSMAYAPAHQVDQRRYAARLRTNLFAIDASLMAGSFADVQKVGLGLAGQLGWVGLRSEWVVSRAARTNSSSKDVYTEVVISADYTSESGIGFLLEAYFNGEGQTDKNRYDFNRLIKGDVLGVARHYIGGQLSKEWSPIFSTSLYAIQNLDDGSRYYYPSLNFIVPQFEDLYVKAGAQLFDGAKGTEYAFIKPLYFIEVKRYF